MPRNVYGPAYTMHFWSHARWWRWRRSASRR